MEEGLHADVNNVITKMRHIETGGDLYRKHSIMNYITVNFPQRKRRELCFGTTRLTWG